VQPIFRPLPEPKLVFRTRRGLAVAIVNKTRRTPVSPGKLASTGGAPPQRKSRSPLQKKIAGAKAGPAAGRPKPVVSARADDPVPILATSVNILRVDAGIYVLQIGPLDRPTREISGMTVPVTHIGSPPRNGAGAEIVASYPQRGPWFGSEGGTAVVNIPASGGQIVVTSYDEPGLPVSAPAVDLRRLDRLDPTVAAGATAVSPSAGLMGDAVREVPTEILLHIERAGDRVFPGRGWVGALGRKLRIEGFSIRPLEGITPGDVEFKAFEPNGQETPWVTAGTLCGTRGRGLPLTGFAVRIADHLRERFDAVYEGSFFNAGIVGPSRNGEPCRSAVGDDPLEAVNIRLIEKAGADVQRNPTGR